MTKEELKKFLENKLPIVNNDIPNINYGGCGVFAKFLSEELSSFKIPHEIYAIYYNDIFAGDNHMEGLQNFIKNHTHPEKAGEDHIVIYVNELDLYFDSEGEVDMFNVDTKIRLTKEQLDTLLKKGNWNHHFHKSDSPKMEKEIKDVFNKIRDSTKKLPHKYEKAHSKNSAKKKVVTA